MIDYLAWHSMNSVCDSFKHRNNCSTMGSLLNQLQLSLWHLHQKKRDFEIKNIELLIVWLLFIIHTNIKEGVARCMMSSTICRIGITSTSRPSGACVAVICFITVLSSDEENKWRSPLINSIFCWGDFCFMTVLSDDKKGWWSSLMSSVFGCCVIGFMTVVLSNGDASCGFGCCSKMPAISLEYILLLLVLLTGLFSSQVMVEK